MKSLFGCTISEGLMAQWSQLLVCEPSPFFIPDTVMLPEETLILSRKAFSEVGFDASFRDSYTVYHISPDGNRVAFLSSAEFDTLPQESQQALLAAQCAMKRGQVYRWKQIEPFLTGCVEQAETRSVSAAGEKYLVLDTKIWQLLSEDMRQAWLVDFVTADKPAVCLSPTLSEADWAAMPYDSIRALAGTFPARSGANCFSTTLAAITHQMDTARTIADFWLHQEPFLEGLERRGYHLLEENLMPDARDRVLIWNDQQGKPQHTCYLIGNGLVVNKNSQSWFSPRQLLYLDTVLNEWKHEPFEIVLYGRG
ncbi:MAG: hypothetical protein H0X30_00490 [Anaerolineae bacterium]|nr:hypothetical protein [Anaerolineae bacterium]